MESSKKLVINGIIWNGIQLVVNQSFSFIVKLVLARLLLPEHFGVIGMAAVFIGFIQIFNDLGIGAALVQKKDEDLTESHFHTAFWTGVGWSVGLYLIISFVVGPLASDFYAQEILKSLIPVLSLGILSSPINMVHKAQLTRKMNFKRIAFIDNTSNIIAGSIAIIMAISGAGVWSLAFNSVATIIIAMPMYFRATGWNPSFIWYKRAFKDIFGFGIFTTGTNVLNYWMQNLDYLLIGKLFTASVLGTYTLAFLLTDIFRMKLMSVINTVMYPVFSKKQKDPQSIARYYFKVIFFNCTIAFPIMIFFVVLGEPFILQFFGEKWFDSIIPLKILALSVMFHMMISGNNALIRGMGKPALELKIQIVKTVIYLPMIAIGVYYYGIIGAAWVVLINKIIAVFFAHYAVNMVLNRSIRAKHLLKEILPPGLNSVIAGLLAYGLFLSGLNYLICGVILFTVYFSTMFFIRKDEIFDLVNEIRRK